MAEIVTSVGDIGNYYGGILIKQCNNDYFWCIENYDGTDWEQIPKYLYDAILKFENERTK